MPNNYLAGTQSFIFSILLKSDGTPLQVLAWAWGYWFIGSIFKPVEVWPLKQYFWQRLALNPPFIVDCILIFRA